MSAECNCSVQKAARKGVGGEDRGTGLIFHKQTLAERERKAPPVPSLLRPLQEQVISIAHLPFHSIPSSSFIDHLPFSSLIYPFSWKHLLPQAARQAQVGLTRGRFGRCCRNLGPVEPLCLGKDVMLPWGEQWPGAELHLSQSDLSSRDPSWHRAATPGSCL